MAFSPVYIARSPESCCRALDGQHGHQLTARGGRMSWAELFRSLPPHTPTAICPQTPESTPTRPGGRSAAHAAAMCFSIKPRANLCASRDCAGIFPNMRLARVIGEKRSVLFRPCCLIFCFAGVCCRLRHERVRDDVQAPPQGDRRRPWCCSSSRRRPDHSQPVHPPGAICLCTRGLQMDEAS